MEVGEYHHSHCSWLAIQETRAPCHLDTNQNGLLDSFPYMIKFCTLLVALVG